MTKWTIDDLAEEIAIPNYRSSLTQNHFVLFLHLE